MSDVSYFLGFAARRAFERVENPALRPISAEFVMFLRTVKSFHESKYVSNCSIKLHIAISGQSDLEMQIILNETKSSRKFLFDCITNNRILSQLF